MLRFRQADDRPLLPEDEQGVGLEPVGSGIHLLAVERKEAGISLVRLCHGEHDTAEVLHLERVLHACHDASPGKHVDEQGTVVARRLHHAVVLITGEFLNEAANAFRGVPERLVPVALL